LRSQNSQPKKERIYGDNISNKSNVSRKSITQPEPVQKNLTHEPKNLTHEPRSVATYNDYDVSEYQGTYSSKPPSNFRSHDMDRKEIKNFMKKSNPCSQKNDESIPVIDISKISGDVSHPPVELLEEEDEGEYKDIHNFFEEDQEVEGEQEEEKQWETEQEETTTQGQEEFKLSSVKEVREPSQHDEGIKMPEPVIMSATPTPLSTVNPTPIKMSETPKVLS
jgi:hypothetical protein